MARPIKPTPVLNARQSNRFLKLVERQENEPLKASSSPDMNRAIELAKANGLFRSK